MSEVNPDKAVTQQRVRKNKARSPEESVKPVAKPVDIDQLRTAKLNEIQVEALKVSNPLQSTLKGAAGDLLFLGYRMKKTIVATLDESEDLSQFDKATPIIELLLKVSRQADRFAHIDQRIAETQKAQSDK